nr:hypothetical protein [Tanacetum cinerariifolium]
TFNPSAEQMETLPVESPIPTASSPVPTAHQEVSPSLDNIISLTNKFDDILGVSTSSNEIIRVEADNPKGSLMLCKTQAGWKLYKKSSFNSKFRKYGLWLIVIKGSDPLGQNGFSRTRKMKGAL